MFREFSSIWEIQVYSSDFVDGLLPSAGDIAYPRLGWEASPEPETLARLSLVEPSWRQIASRQMGSHPRIID